MLITGWSILDYMKRSTAKLPPIQQAIETVLEMMGFSDYRVAIQSSSIPGHVTYNITGPDSALLIGRDGRNLEALSKIVREIVLSRQGQMDKHFATENYVIDIDDYQDSEIKKLLAFVELRLSELRQSDETTIELQPMPSFKRRIVHAYVQDKTELKSESIGSGRDRRVIIKS
jgi:spoIIIJ-associated protein